MFEVSQKSIKIKYCVHAYSFLILTNVSFLCIPFCFWLCSTSSKETKSQ